MEKDNTYWITVALKTLNPDSQSGTWNGKVIWDGKETPIDDETLQKKVAELQAEYDAQEYARNRQADYPDWGIQLNKIYDDGLTKWKAEMVDPVKTKWPKDNSGPV